MQNNMISALADFWKFELPEWSCELIDYLSVSKDLSPYDVFVYLNMLRLTMVSSFPDNTIEREDIVKDQLKSCDSLFKNHMNNMHIFKNHEGFIEYNQEETYAYTVGTIPVTNEELLSILNPYIDEDPNTDLNGPVAKLINLFIHACYFVYGHSEQLEEDINKVLYNYSDAIRDLVESES